MEPNSFQRFPRTTLASILLFTLCTLGLYVPYWLYTRTRILNTLCPEKPVPALIIALCMGGLLMFLYMMFQFIGQTPPPDSLEQIQNNPEFLKLMDAAMIVNFLQLFWGLVICQRLNHCTRSRPGDAAYSSYFLLVLAHLLVVNIFYLQYKINELIDTGIQTQNTLGIM